MFSRNRRRPPSIYKKSSSSFLAEKFFGLGSKVQETIDSLESDLTFRQNYLATRKTVKTKLRNV